MMTDKAAQLKAKLLKIKLAETDYEIAAKVHRSKAPLKKQVPFGKDDRDPDKIRDDALDKSEASTSGKKIRPKKPTDEDRNRIITAKAKIKKLKEKTSIPDEIMQEASDAAGLNKNQAPSYIAQEHGHKIAFKGHKIGGFKSASLSGQSGKYAKYWLLNAKETNGNGWGIAAHTAKENMKKFIGRPLVVTASSWHGASEYGDEYEHPYLPTNDISAILNHQEKFRVGSIVDVFEDSHGDWFASVEMLPKFASSRLPPFCSPAIYQLDASEAEGQISKWEALHLAALTENPAYGARIALLKGTCVGTDNECKVQFKAAKQDGIECPIKKKERISKLKSRLAGKRENDILNSALALREHGGVDASKFDTPLSEASKDTPQVTTGYRLFEQTGRGDKKAGGIALSNSFAKGRMRKLGKLKARLAFQDVTEPFKTQPPKEPYKLHSRSKEIEEHGLKTVGESDDFNGGHFLTTGGRLIGTGKSEHRDMSHSILKTFDDKDFNDMASNADSKQMSRWGTDGRNMQHLLKNTGMARVSTGLLGDVEGQSGINIDTSHPLTKSQRSRITQYLEDNNVPPDNVFIDDYTNTQSIRKQLRLGKLKLKLAGLGDENMTYQDSKKVKIIKKKHPEVRKAKSSVEDILRGKGRSVDGSHSQSTFLSSAGDFIGGGVDNEPHRSQVGLLDDSELVKFQKDTGLIRVQNFPVNRSGDKKMSLGINSKVNSTQLKSIKDSETEGKTIGFSVGDLGKEVTGEGYRDLTKTLREQKFLG